MAAKTKNNKKSPRKPERKQEELRDASEIESDCTASNDIEPSTSNFEVEAVLGKQYDIDGNIFYLLHWKSWDGEPTWEPEENCSCKGLIEDFEKNVVNKSKLNKRETNSQIKILKKKSPVKVKTSAETVKLRRITRNSK